MNKIIDCHTHTKFSPDGKDYAEKMCDRAMELGLQAYAITDHCEVSTWFEESYYREKGVPKSEDPFVIYDYKKLFYDYLPSISKLKEKYDGKLNLICGIELGQATQGYEGADEVADNKELDFIIGSLHQNRGKDDFGFLEYDKNDSDSIYSLLNNYFDEMLEMCKWGKFDVLGHLTYPIRYISGDYGIELDLSRYEEIIREIFCTLIQNGKGIEINTSGLWQKYGKPFPTIDYVKLYKELGGEIISIGSDSHCVKDLGGGVEVGAKIAKDVGFNYLTYFKNRKPEFVKI